MKDFGNTKHNLRSRKVEIQRAPLGIRIILDEGEFSEPLKILDNSGEAITEPVV
jgi:hypothetical protein